MAGIYLLAGVPWAFITLGVFSSGLALIFVGGWKPQWLMPLKLLSSALDADGARAEGEYRPGPYLIDGGWLSAKAGRLTNWWRGGLLHPASGRMQRDGRGVRLCLCADRCHVAPAIIGGAKTQRRSREGYNVCPCAHFETAQRLPVDLGLSAEPDAIPFMGRERRLPSSQSGMTAPRLPEPHLMRDGMAQIGTDGSIFYWLGGNEIVDGRFDLL